jgi:hypothetical protein
MESDQKENGAVGEHEKAQEYMCKGPVQYYVND